MGTAGTGIRIEDGMWSIEIFLEEAGKVRERVAVFLSRLICMGCLVWRCFSLARLLEKEEVSGATS